MPTQRFATSTSGNGRRLGAAALPVPAGVAQGYQSRGQVFGFPGTYRVPAPAPVPGAGLDGSEVAQAQAGNIGLPSSMFSFWTPSIYYTRTPQSSGSRAPVSVFSDNQMPVPAVDPRGLPAVMMPGPVMLNQWQVPNPRVTPHYPNRKKKRG